MSAQPVSDGPRPIRVPALPYRSVQRTPVARRRRPDDLPDLPTAECRRRSGYVRCRCSHWCMDINAAANRHRGEPRQDTEPVARHLEQLLTGPVSLGDAVEHFGMTYTQLGKILRRTNPKVAASTARRILSARKIPCRTGPYQMIPATLIYRRLDALACSGWTIEHVSVFVRERTGLSCRRILQDRTRVAYRRMTFEAVDEFFRDRVRQVGPSGRAAGTARRVGKLPAGVWRDIDDLEEIPDVSAIRDEVWRDAARARLARDAGRSRGAAS